MYNSQEISERIKKRAKTCGFSMKTMLSDLELGINLISQLSKGQNITAINLAKIADYLDCSVDYLLGRDWGFNISGLSNTEKEIIDKFRSLSDEGRDYIQKTLEIASYKYSNMPDEMAAYDVEDTVIDEYKPKKPETTAD